MLSATELVRKFESAAQNLVDQKLPKQMVTLTEGVQLLEQYEMVLFIYNISFLFCLFHCVLALLISGKVKEI